jgi:hypothetical protein
MGRQQGGRAGLAVGGASLNRYVTDEQHSRRPIFIATLRAGALAVFLRFTRTTRIAQIWALSRRRKNSRLTSGNATSYFGDRTPGAIVGSFQWLPRAAWSAIRSSKCLVLAPPSWLAGPSSRGIFRSSFARAMGSAGFHQILRTGEQPTAFLIFGRRRALPPPFLVADERACPFGVIPNQRIGRHMKVSRLDAEARPIAVWI